MTHMISSFEFQETNGFYSLKKQITIKPKSRKLEKNNITD